MEIEEGVIHGVCVFIKKDKINLWKDLDQLDWIVRAENSVARRPSRCFRNPPVPGWSPPTLATCWMYSRWNITQLLKDLCRETKCTAAKKNGGMEYGENKKPRSLVGILIYRTWAVDQYLTINERGWVSYKELWKSRRVLSTASTDNTLRDLHNSSYDTKSEFNNCFLIHSK